MTSEEALEMIRKALAATLETEAAIGPDTDLLTEEILDSLDGVKFAFQLEEMASVRFPSEDLASKGYFKVANLITFLTGESAG